jgi:DNA invertase Pin-like site-specific DNA recombinase
MNTRIEAFYGRQSVDKKDSISIKSQREFCQYELRGGSCRDYTDKGYSGKNTDRPKFQELIRDIEQGLISKVVVYKLDRISRSIIDFANMMELFNKHNVEFTSATEKFDTSTPMGRAMLNICIVFAQLERETIQRRVRDAYYSRCQKGFHMSGRAPYGYTLTPSVVDGINTKVLTTDPEAVKRVKLLFEMYAQPHTSIGDIARYLTDQGITIGDGGLTRGTLSCILKNPVYAQADLDVYEFFKGQGAVIVNDAEDFAGTNGCYYYQGRDVADSKRASLKDQILVIAPHEGIVPSETWLACRRKLLSNTAFTPTSKKAKNSWLTGKIKCGRCGYALNGVTSQNGVCYLRCRKRVSSKACLGCGKLRVPDVEKFIYDEMCRKMDEFQTLTGHNPNKGNPKLTALNVSLAQVEAGIEKLLDTLSGASSTLLSYANTRIETLDAERQSLLKQIADLTAESISPERMDQIAGDLNDWDNVCFEDRQLIVDGLILVVRATSENIQIEWKL